MASASEHREGAADQTLVFVNTSLDTHLAVPVYGSDTVLDIKNRIMLVHRELFPAIGNIEVKCVEIKQRGNFYRLGDSMHVSPVTKPNTILWVDASRLEENYGTQHLGEYDGGDQPAHMDSSTHTPSSSSGEGSEAMEGNIQSGEENKMHSGCKLSPVPLAELLRNSSFYKQAVSRMENTESQPTPAMEGNLQIGGKNRMRSECKPSLVPLTDIIRRSSCFKKGLLAALKSGENTESQPVDSVAHD